MRYEEIYMIEGALNERYLLKKNGKNKLIIIGVNPSKATDKKPDLTMTKVMKFAEYNGFDGFIMFNLYPQRSTNPINLDKEMNIELHKRNLNIISDTIKDIVSPTILFAFGDAIKVRPYLKDCLKDIVSLFNINNSQWKQIGKPTILGNPRHPSRAGYCEFEPFDINTYICSY